MSKLIKLTVISDNICPWCYVGLKEVQAAVAQARQNNLPVEFDVEYKPYLLDPTLDCRTPIDKSTHYHKKFGPERMAQAQKMLCQRGEELGINFKFGGKLRQTTLSHRLLLSAYRKGGQDLQQKVLNKILAAYFENQQDIGDLEVLADIAESTGAMTKPEALKFLASDELCAEVKADICEAQQNGITGVPFTIINSKYAISGAQKAQTFYQLFEQLANTGVIS